MLCLITESRFVGGVKLIDAVIGKSQIFELIRADNLQLFSSLILLT